MTDFSGSALKIYNPNCPCTKADCPNHGNCTDCRKRHKTVEGINPLPYCERPENKK